MLIASWGCAATSSSSGTSSSCVGPAASWQGRGSANSAVCYALGITACDPLKMDLLFERFLSEERGEWPDIDLDHRRARRAKRSSSTCIAKHTARTAAP